ncbi:hypothetical protein Cgig2_030063 [Carnegiea gigantea]|uniref:Agglutinin domain-containing protein n=1 Tax=Carnegiea gigantea TaxID=171969 RepID=A0A9Q1GNA4_9CARY|nr:hypothetical protein Cgig2_030063 [Carnegiea gigantea]
MDPYTQFEVEKAKTWAGLVHLKSRGHLIMTGSLHLLIRQTKTRAAGLAPCSSLSSSRIPMALKSSDCCTSSSAITHAFRGVPPPLTLACLRDPRILTKTHATFWPPLIGNPSLGSLDVLPSRVTTASSWGPLCTMASLALDLHSVILRSEHYGKFWRTGEDDWNWIVVDAEDPRSTENTDVMFRHSVLDTNSVTLFSMKTTTFLKRYTSTARESFLRALAPNIDRFTHLLVVDVDE